MKEKKEKKEKNAMTEEQKAPQQAEGVQCGQEDEAPETVQETPEQKKISELTAQLEEARKQSEEYLDRLRRSMAEFDNFRKRTVKEKEQESDFNRTAAVG